MALSPEDIEGREFGLSRRGYDREEVDDFLLEVAGTVREAEATAEAAEAQAADADATSGVDPAVHPLRARLGSGPDETGDADEFELLGAEVAAVLRAADEGAAKRRADADAEATRIRDEADGYAHRLRVETEAEAERIRAEADVEARNARTALAEASEQARVTVQEATARAEALTAEAEESAGARRRELLAQAEIQADQAAAVERDVHGRLLSVRDDVDQAVARLDPEATAAIAEQASALVPGDREAWLGQGPPTSPVPPPAAPTDLPYASDDEPVDDDVIDLTEGSDDGGSDLPYADDDVDAADDIPPAPPPPPPPPGYEPAATDDLPYASDDDADEGDGDDTGEDADDDNDPLAAMVRDAVGKAVKGTTGRNPDDNG